MNIDRMQVTIRELIDGYEEKGDEGIEGVVAYGGKLDVRPAYQREYIYGEKDRDEVIRSVKKGFPLNVMYWSKVGPDHYELMDGQQRTISICRYAAAEDERNLRSFERCFPVDERFFYNLQPDQREAILNYPLDIYVCDGSPTEVLDWFRIINIAGKVLTQQELRNTSFTGPWLADAKLYFSKPNCRAYKLYKDYMSGSPIRQEYLETAIQWAADKDGVPSIDQYMALHQHDDNANQLWIYFQRVMQWVQAIFPNYRKEMKGLDWGLLYNRHKDDVLDPDVLEARIKELMMDDEVTKKAGIYTYVLTGEEKHLSLRAFTEAQKRAAYERQGGICPDCHQPFAYEQMQGDHITPWSQGGKTVPENCAMRCADCNRHKSDH